MKWTKPANRPEHSRSNSGAEVGGQQAQQAEDHRELHQQGGGRLGDQGRRNSEASAHPGRPVETAQKSGSPLTARYRGVSLTE